MNQEPVDNYFGRVEVSNSDLSWLKMEMLNPVERRDFRDAYRMGSLIDAMITEPLRVNYFENKLYNYPEPGHHEQFTADEFATCERMKVAFRQDEFCQNLLRQSTGQAVMSAPVEFSCGGFDFTLPMRCKFDLWSDELKWGGDIKSTTATTQKQFEDAVRYFDYDRQRAEYMLISGAKRDMLIGISKINFKVFKIPITINSPTFIYGHAKLTELALRWWTLLADL